MNSVGGTNSPSLYDNIGIGNDEEHSILMFYRWILILDIL